MASKQSLFQALPTLVEDMIVEYLEGRSRNSFYANIDNYNMYKAALAPLLFVGQHWRAAALPSICDNCSLMYDSYLDTIEVDFPACPADFSYRLVDKNSHIKHVAVRVSTWTHIRNGAFSETPIKPKYKDMVFPSATTLELRLDKPLYEIPSASLKVGKNQVASFARSLLRVTPAAVNIRVLIDFIGEENNDYNELYSTLVSELCQANIRTLYIQSLFREIPLSLKLRGASELTSITHDVDSFQDTFARLAYRNARSLRTLRMRLHEESDWHALRYSGTNVPAVYGSLATLNLQIDEYFRFRSPTAVDRVEPFPSLVELSVNGIYPFLDDLFFRGNGKSMQTLSIPFKAIANNALGRYDVLKRSGVGRMSRVCIGKAYEKYSSYTAEQEAPLIRLQVHCILEMAATLDLWDDTNNYDMLSAIISAPSTAVLQRLETGNLELDAVHILQIVYALPSLVVITCDICKAGKVIAAIPAPEHSSSRLLGQDFASNSFRKLCVSYTTTASASRIARVAMAVAAMCPNPVHVDMTPKLRKEFSRHITKVGQPYPGSINRLAYIE
ncbi:hypothetical protein GGF42_004021 [Coemansia sp. RSA 2424]|nr:hypothetical protein GGF42_004021 [Coemansia sp. RSA 2424]